MFTISYLLTLLATIAIELIVVTLMGYRKKSLIVIVIMINLITNPLLNYLLWLNNIVSIFSTHIVYLLIFEIIVVIAEWLLLLFSLNGKVKSGNLLLLSFLMNLSSFAMGLIFFK